MLILKSGIYFLHTLHCSRAVFKTHIPTSHIISPLFKDWHKLRRRYISSFRRIISEQRLRTVKLVASRYYLRLIYNIKPAEIGFYAFLQLVFQLQLGKIFFVVVCREKPDCVFSRGFSVIERIFRILIKSPCIGYKILPLTIHNRQKAYTFPPFFSVLWKKYA